MFSSATTQRDQADASQIQPGSCLIKPVLEPALTIVYVVSLGDQYRNGDCGTIASLVGYTNYHFIRFHELLRDGVTVVIRLGDEPSLWN